MPRSSVIHYNPPESVPMWKDYKGKTRCGRRLREGGWTEDMKDVTCDRCLQLWEIDKR